MKSLFTRNPKGKSMFLTLKILFILSGLLQGISVMLTIPLFKALFSGQLDQVMIWLGYIGLAALLCFIFHFIGVNMGNHMSVWEVCDHQTRELGSAIIKLPLGWFDASSKGKISKAISTDVNTLGHYPPIVLPEILTVLSTSGVIAVSLLFISLRYALILMVMIPLMAYFWKRIIHAMTLVEAENVRANEKMESTIVEFAQLQPVLRASGALLHGWEPLDKALLDDRDATVNTLKKKGESTFKYMLVVNMGTILIFLLSAWELKSGTIELYTFVGIVVAMMRFANPLAGLLGYLAEVFNERMALKRVQSITHGPRLPEAAEGIPLAADGKFGIRFNEVDFSYVKGTTVLKNINLTIPANKVTALVGASGSGKSTINKLVARFWDVDSGEIFINGINIKNIPTPQLMAMISMVFQEVYLFNTTIRDNLAIARPDATEEEMMEAAKKSRLDEVIERLPHGWDTMVGEGGSALSGGEKQRVSIARAFLKNAPILLLDEITSALDGVNEAIITQSIEELSKDKTVIVIAHRLSSIQHADQIAIVDDGEIIGLGTHDNLLQGNEKYQRLWNALKHAQTWEM